MIKKYLITLILCLFFASPAWSLPALMGQMGQSSGGGAASYCDNQSWNTLTDFRLDFDHTTDNKNACLSAGTETGALTSATIVTPATVSPLSGGNALLADGDTHYIDFDRDALYFNSQFGELMSSVQLTGDNTGLDKIVTIVEIAAQDRLEVCIAATGQINVYWEDNNGGAITVTQGDLDAYYGDWAQIHVKWDTTRCTDGDGFCADANEDELCLRVRIDDNRDGDFEDGGAEDWSAWACENSDVDLEIWSAEPTTNDYRFGITGATHSQNIYIDDVEMTATQPVW